MENNFYLKENFTTYSQTSTEKEEKSDLVYVDLMDFELVNLMKENDPKAFQYLYNRYKNILYTVVYRLIKHEEDARDIMQDFFISIWDQRHTLEIKSSIKWYLITAIRYKSISHIRKNIVRFGVLSYVDDFEKLSLEKVNFEHHDPSAFKELQTCLDREIQSLSPRMKEIFVLYRESDLSHKEIALKLGLSHQVIRNKVSDALKILRHRLKDQVFLLGFLLYKIFFHLF